jgi:hypothetical protein
VGVLRNSLLQKLPNAATQRFQACVYVRRTMENTRK